MDTTPLFFIDVQRAIDLSLLVVALVIEAFAFLNCLTQRSDAFGAIGTLSKGAWLALTGGALLVTLLSPYVLGLLGFIAITIAAIYLLDVRPALRDAADGPNPW
jgi:Protein of unknown function (DUF2516)